MNQRSLTSKTSGYDTSLSNKFRLEYLDDAKGLDKAGTKQKHSVEKEATRVTNQLHRETEQILTERNNRKAEGTHTLSLRRHSV